MSTVKTEVPALNDSKISDALESADSVFDTYQNSLDRISDDIKNLEAYLQSKGITCELEFPFRNTDEGYDNLAWTKDESSNKFRLHCVFFKWARTADGKDLAYNEDGGSIEVFHKKTPLIQCCSSVRIEAVKSLPRLVEELSEKVAALNKEGQPQEDEDEPLHWTEVVKKGNQKRSERN